MKDVVRSSCPNCNRPLKIPTEWTGKSVRCKHCGQSMEVRRKTPPATATVPTGPPPLPAARAVESTPKPTRQAGAATEELPEYTPPVVSPAASVPPVTAPLATQGRYTGRGRYKGPRNRNWLKYAVLVLFFAGLAGGAVAVAKYKPEWVDLLRGGQQQQANNNSDQPGDGTTTTTTVTEPPPPIPGASGTFPRRMLAISIHSYLYANPLHNGESNSPRDEENKTGTDAAIVKLAERWRVPKEQLYHLTDAPLRDERRPKVEPKTVPKKKGAKGKDAAETLPPKTTEFVEPPPRPKGKVPPLKNVIEGTITQFLNTSRAQDHIVFVFCGHIVEKMGEVYIVPLEGDLDEVDSLIPLKWFYEKLGACKAQEKVVIWDVCRFHPGRGIERPHPGPMTEAMEKALHDSPDGVSVITTCSKDERALETDYVRSEFKDVRLQGSMFLSLLHLASFRGALSPENKIPVPADPLPVQRMVDWMAEKLTDVVKRNFDGTTQTVKATLKKGETVAFNPAEPMPSRFPFPIPPPSADPRAVLAIVREIQLPPVKSFREDAPPPSISDILPFTEEALKPYLAGELRENTRPNEFQKAILDAVAVMRSIRQQGSGSDLPDFFGGSTPDSAKEALRKVQEIPARVEGQLGDHLEKLESMADQKDKQPKRWQVHYDYVVAQLKLRICYAVQYNLALANVRGGKLPDLKEDQNGYRLTAETTLDKNTPANYKEMFNEARKALADISKDNPNTPWALLAKSDRTVAIGLRLTGSSVTGGVR
jgi:hypothetical protein